MPLLAGSRVLSFSFRRRRDSSTSSSAHDHHPSPSTPPPPIPAIPSQHVSKTLSSTDPDDPATLPLPPPPRRHMATRSSDTLSSFRRRSRHASFDFDRLQARVSATVRLRGKSHDPGQALPPTPHEDGPQRNSNKAFNPPLIISSSPLPQRPVQVNLPWQETSHNKSSPTVQHSHLLDPRSSTSVEPSPHSLGTTLLIESNNPASDSSSLTLSSQRSGSQQTKLGSIMLTAQAPPQLELSLPASSFFSPFPGFSSDQLAPTLQQSSSSNSPQPNSTVYSRPPMSPSVVINTNSRPIHQSPPALAVPASGIPLHPVPDSPTPDNPLPSCASATPVSTTPLDPISNSPRPQSGGPRPTGAIPNYSSRIRPTPAPRPVTPLAPPSTPQAPGSTTLPEGLQPAIRRTPPLPSRLRALPRLSSYICTNPPLSIGRQLSGSSDSSGQIESNNHEADGQESEAPTEGEEESDADDGITSEGCEAEADEAGNQTITNIIASDLVDAPTAIDNRLPRLADSSNELDSDPQADFAIPLSRPGWVTFAAATPPVADPIHRTDQSSATFIGPRTHQALPLQQTPTPRQTAVNLSKSCTVPSYFDPRLSSSSISSVQSPGDRARRLLLAPSTSSAASGPGTVSSRRPSLTPRRSQSMMNFHMISTDLNSNPAGLAEINEAEDSAQVMAAHDSTLDDSNGSEPAAPKEQLVKKVENVGSPDPNLLTLPTEAPHGPFAHRRQSMYEMRSSMAQLPPYQDIVQGSNGIRHVILPREEEGREGLPRYTCAIHLEGWMPRKMEFRSPGIQAKDRAWKRQYVILHGTMIRIYRSDPHVTPIPSGVNDSYIQHHVQRVQPLPVHTKPSMPSVGPLHFHEGRYDSAPSTSLKEAAFAKASQLPTQHNTLQRVYTLQNAESGLAADYLKRKYIVRVRAEGEQFLLQAKDDRGVIDLIEALQAATNVSLDLDVRPLPKFITLPRRRRRRRANGNTPIVSSAVDGREIGAAVVESMIAEAEASNQQHIRERLEEARRQSVGLAWQETSSDRMADMLAEEQEAYMTSRN